jgi:hypothetical protein
MLASIFKPSIDNTTVKQCLAHILSKMDYDKYRNALYVVNKYPGVTRKFVVLEYIHSPSESTILQTEYVPGTRAYIHNVIQHPDFRANMISVFGNVVFYTRRKQDFSKPLEDRLTNTRQLVIQLHEEPTAVLNPEDDDMPPLIPCVNRTVTAAQAMYGY